MKFHIRNVENANQAHVISLKKTVFTLAVVRILIVIALPITSFVGFRSFEKTAAQMGLKRHMMDKNPPTRPTLIMLANISLWGCVNTFLSELGRFGFNAVNLFETS